MSSSAVLSDNTLQQANDRQAALLKNINNLQTMESDLYKQLPRFGIWHLRKPF